MNTCGKPNFPAKPMHLDIRDHRLFIVSFAVSLY